MSLKYCLPISLELDSSNRLERLLIALYLVPLIPLYIACEIPVAILVSVLSASLLGYELNVQLAFRGYAGVYISQGEQWNLVNSHGELEKIVFKSAMNAGASVFLLFYHNGRRRRLLLAAKNQNMQQLHKLRVYLGNCT